MAAVPYTETIALLFNLFLICCYELLSVLVAVEWHSAGTPRTRTRTRTRTLESIQCSNILAPTKLRENETLEINFKWKMADYGPSDNATVRIYPMSSVSYALKDRIGRLDCATNPYLDTTLWWLFVCTEIRRVAQPYVDTMLWWHFVTHSSDSSQDLD